MWREFWCAMNIKELELVTWKYLANIANECVRVCLNASNITMVIVIVHKVYLQKKNILRLSLPRVRI